MKRILITTSILSLMGGVAYSQVGVNTENPNATIDIVATKTDATTAEGIIAPRLTRTQVAGKDAKYTTNQTGTIVYVTDVTGTTTSKTAKIDKVGYYYFDGALWQPFTAASAAAASNPWNKVGTITPSTLNTDNSYLTAQAIVGGNTAASINGGTANAQLTVTGADASINGITVGKGKGNIASNTAVGGLSLNANTTGAENTSVGANALFVNTTGTQNTAVGSVALIASNGSQNTAIGRWALTGNISGNNNTGVGVNALQRNITGNNNTALGNSAGNLQTAGDNNIMIGANTQVPVVTGSNQINIGNTIYGTVGATAATGAVSIGKTAPDASAMLDVSSPTANKGILIPKVALTSVNDAVTIANPAKGLEVYSTTSNTTMNEGRYVNIGTPAAPVWSLMSPPLVPVVVLDIPPFLTPNAVPEIYGASTPIFTLRTINWNNYGVGGSGTDIVLPDRGLYGLLLRSAFMVNYDSRTSLPGSFTIQYLVSKNGAAIFDGTSIVVSVPKDVPTSGNAIIAVPMTMLHLSGEKGDKFRISIRCTKVYPTDYATSIELLGNNINYTSASLMKLTDFKVQ